MAPAFTPSVVLLVGEPGRCVLEQLGQLLELASLPAPLARGVALLTVDAAGGRLEAAPATLPGPGAPTPAGAAGPLGPLLVAAVEQDVRSLATVAAIREAGYTMGNQVQVLVVGATDDPGLPAAAALASDEIARHGVRATVCCLAETGPPAPAGTAGPPAPAGPGPDLSLLFGSRIVHPQTAYVTEPALRRHVMAQALFALVATGIPLDPGFAELVEREAGDPYDKGGSLRACLVLFPRAAVERYCAAGLARDLVDDCLALLREARTGDGEAVPERSEAASLVDGLWRRLDDGAPRPGSDPDAGRRPRAPAHLWPALDLLVPAAGAGGSAAGDLAALGEDSRRLFGLFDHDGVDRDAGRSPARDWLAAAGDRANCAPDRWRAWRRSAEVAWQPAGACLVAQVAGAMERRWTAGAPSLALARSFAGECALGLTRTAGAAVALRERHDREHRHAFATYLALAGPWLREQDDPGPDPAFTGPELAPGEQRVAKALGERAAALRAPAPPLTTLLGPALAALAAAGAALLALAPAAVSPGWRAAAALPVFLAAGAAAGLWLRGRRRRRARAAESDLLRFLCRCYAHRCELVEDRLRVAALGPLRRWLQHTLHALHQAEPFLAAVRGRLAEEAREVESSLFASPPALLDVLVAEGRALRPAGGGPAGPGRVTLEEVLRVVRDRAASAAGPDGLHPAFLSWLPPGPGILATDDGEARDFLRERVREAFVAPHLGDPAACVLGALDQEDVRALLARQLEGPLFELRGDMQARRRYACGWRLEPGEGEAAGAVAGAEPIPIRERDRWLFAALFASAPGTPLDPELLRGLLAPAGAPAAEKP